MSDIRLYVFEGGIGEVPLAGYSQQGFAAGEDPTAKIRLPLPWFFLTHPKGNVVIERSTGAAPRGAVAVGGGAENVRAPRLPALKRGAASDVTANASVSATAASASAERNRKVMVVPLLGSRTPGLSGIIWCFFALL